MVRAIETAMDAGADRPKSMPSGHPTKMHRTLPITVTIAIETSPPRRLPISRCRPMVNISMTVARDEMEEAPPAPVPAAPRAWGPIRAPAIR